MQIDENLNWKTQINQVRINIIRNFQLLKRVRFFIDYDTALMVYNTLLQPHFDCCSIIWMNGNSTDLKRLQILQNRTLRIVLGVDARYNREAWYNTIGTL